MQMHNDFTNETSLSGAQSSTTVPCPISLYNFNYINLSPLLCFRLRNMGCLSFSLDGSEFSSVA